MFHYPAYRNIYIPSHVMTKPRSPHSRQTREALGLLAELIRAGRIERKMTAKEMAERAGISRPLLRRIENANPGCAIGSVFEVAVLAGVPLFEAEPGRLKAQRAAVKEKLTLLPQRARKSKRVIRDDF